MTRVWFSPKGLVGLGVLAGIAVACSRGGPPVVTSPETFASLTPSPTGEATITNTVTPTPTPAPLAARVNGFEITLAEYQAELALYRVASGSDLTPEDEKRVLDDLIDRALLAQAAAEKGFDVDDALLASRLKDLSDPLGGEEALSDWINAHGYTPDGFRRALRRSIGAAWMRDQIIAAVPERAEQVHARQILLYNSDQANEVFVQLEAGNSFYNLALEYDPVTGGDLGWFPRGYLPDANLEATVFSLEPDQYSPVIETPAGFHILQVLERDPQRLLDPEALRILQLQALRDWLVKRRVESEIQMLLP